MAKPITEIHLRNILDRTVRNARSQATLDNVRRNILTPIIDNKISVSPETTKLALQAQFRINLGRKKLPAILDRTKAAPQADLLIEPSSINSVTTDLDFLLDPTTKPEDRAYILMAALDKSDGSRELAIDALANREIPLNDLEGSQLLDLYLKLRTGGILSNEVDLASEVVFAELENHPDQLTRLVAEMTRKKIPIHQSGVNYLRAFAGDPSTDNRVRDGVLQYLQSVPPAMPVLTPPPPLTGPVRLPAPALDNSVFSGGSSSFIDGFNYFNLGGLGAISDIGCRKEQQDAVLLAIKNGRILALAADGMGGHNSGDIASSLAVKVNDKLFMEANDYTLQHGVLEADQAIKKEAAADPVNNAGMGTTLSAILFEGRRYATQVIGDTRIYRLRNGELSLLSLDESYMAMTNQLDLTDKKDKLTLPMEEHSSAQYHNGVNELKGKNTIINALGIAGKQPSLRQAGQGEVRAGDLYLITTDGFHGFISFEELKQLVDNTISQDAAAISLALHNQAVANMRTQEAAKAQEKGREPRAIGFGDNVSVVAVKIDEDVLAYLDTYAPAADQRHTVVYNSTPPAPETKPSKPAAPAPQPEIEVTIEPEEPTTVRQIPAQTLPSVEIHDFPPAPGNPFLSASNPFDPFTPDPSRTANTVVNQPKPAAATQPAPWYARLAEKVFSFFGGRRQEIEQLKARLAQQEQAATAKIEAEGMARVLAEHKYNTLVNRTVNIAGKLKAGESIGHDEALELLFSFQK
ncbi:MAG: protein phosphatase 2C domain-containing protein, partial [Candidatus Margulisiibacteriota bacterium]